MCVSRCGFGRGRRRHPRPAGPQGHREGPRHAEERRAVVRGIHGEGDRPPLGQRLLRRQAAAAESVRRRRLSR